MSIVVNNVNLCQILCLLLIAKSTYSYEENGYYSDIKDALYSIKSYLQSGLVGLAKVARTLEAVEQFVDATIDEDCEPYTCPRGFVRRAEPEHKPISNGCGSFGFQWKRENLPHKELEECCHVHDYCYDECGADKDVCDLHFKRCLYKVCSDREKELSVLNLKACKGTAKLMYTGTLALGCKAYQEAQNKACRCVRRDEM